MTNKTIILPILLAAFGALVLGTAIYANIAKADTQVFEDKLNQAVESGRITQEQADQKKEWRENSEKSKAEYLQGAVDKGTITQEEASKINDWWDSRPEALDKLKPLKDKSFHGSFHKKGIYKK